MKLLHHTVGWSMIVLVSEAHLVVEGVRGLCELLVVCVSVLREVKVSL